MQQPEDTHTTLAHSGNKVNIFIVLLLFVVFVPSSFIPVANSISLTYIVPLLFLYSFIKSPRLALQYRPLLLYAFLLAWSIITTVKARDVSRSREEIEDMIGVLVFSYIIIQFSFQNRNYLYVFYALYILKFLAIIYFARTLGLGYGETDTRFGAEELNANMFGYYGFFAIVSALFLWQQTKLRAPFKQLLFILFLICIFVSIGACFYSASRAGIAISIITAALFISIYFFYPLSKRIIIGILLVTVTISVVLPFLSSYYQGSFLESRIQIVSIEDETRYGLIEKAFQVGLKNPIFGVGPGNFILHSGKMHYSHTTYLELWANNGFLGVILYVLILLYFIRRSLLLGSYGSIHRKTALYFFGFIGVFAVYNLFYVFHINPYLMGFLFVVLVNLETSLDLSEEEYSLQEYLE